MTETWYICVYKFRDMTTHVESQEGISAFCDGFWINSDYELTKGSDCLYWIPPCRIMHVQKEIRSLL